MRTFVDCCESSFLLLCVYSAIHYIKKNKYQFHGLKWANTGLGYIKGQTSSGSSGNAFVYVSKHQHIDVCRDGLLLLNGQFG